jgi:hypothetical protein
MADLEDDSTFRAAVAAHLKEGVYRISRRISRGGTYYLTRLDMDVEASLLNEKSNSQIVSPFSCSWPLSSCPFTVPIQWSVKPHIEVVGLYTITSFEDPDLCLTYDTSSNIVVDGISQYWNLDVRGSQFV